MCTPTPAESKKQGPFWEFQSFLCNIRKLFLSLPQFPYLQKQAPLPNVTRALETLFIPAVLPALNHEGRKQKLPG